VRGGRDRDGLAGGVERGRHVREAAQVDPAHVEEDAPARVEHALHGEGDLVARRQLVHEALAALVDQERALAAGRLGDQEAVVARLVVDERGRVELRHLEVGELGPGVLGERHARADRPARVGGALPERGGAAGREDGRPRAHDRLAAAPAGQLRAEADAAAVVAPQRAGGRALQHLDVLVLGHEGRQLARDALAGGAAARVHDAADRVPALEPEGERAAAVGVEGHAEALQVAHGRRRLLAEGLHGAAARGVAAGGERVGEVALGGVVGRQGGGDPALGPEAGGLG
jgi:hypothetical protein